MATYQLPQATAAAPAAAPRAALMSVGPATQTTTAPVPGTDPVQVAALPREVDLAVYKGDDFYLDVFVFNPDGTDADLSGATPSAQIRAVPNGDDILASFDATVDTNIIHLHLPHEQSANLTGPCAWDVQIDTPRNVRQTHTSTWAWSTDQTGASNPADIGLAGPGWDSPDLFVSVTDADGDDQSGYLAQVQPGDQIRVELVSDRARFADYTVSNPPVLVDQFYEFPVAVGTSGGDPPSAGEPTKLTVPTAVIAFDIITLAAGAVSVSGEVTMP